VTPINPKTIAPACGEAGRGVGPGERKNRRTSKFESLKFESLKVWKFEI